MSDFNRFINFIDAERPAHPRGLTFDTVLAMTPDQFEHTHDFIGWLFPTTYRSKFNIDGPVLTTRELESLRGVNGVYPTKYLTRSIDRMLQHLDTTDAWVSERNNHNALRVTRMLDHVAAISPRAAAALFRNNISPLVYNKKCAYRVSDMTMAHWLASAYGISVAESLKIGAAVRGRPIS